MLKRGHSGDAVMVVTETDGDVTEVTCLIPKPPR